MKFLNNHFSQNCASGNKQINDISLVAEYIYVNYDLHVVTRDRL